MKFSELWELSGKVYNEIVFQSSFSLRMGGTLPQTGKVEKNIADLVRGIRMGVWINKIIMAFFIGFIGISTLFSGTLVEFDRELAIVSSVSTTLSIILFMMAFMGLQVTTSFVSSRVSDFLIPLSISRSDVSKIFLICFIRIFDLPLLVAALFIPVSYAFLYGSILGSLVILLSVIVTEVFALTLAVLLALSFYSRVIKGGGRSKWKTFMRILYMAMWTVATFIVYVSMSFVTQMSILVKTISQYFSFLLSLSYPFSLGFLVSFTTMFRMSDPYVLALSLGSSLVYFALATYSSRWLVRKIVGIGSTNIVVAGGGKVVDTFIKPGPPWLGTVKKDFKIATRSPSYFGLLIMPVIQSAILSFSLVPLLSNLDGVPSGTLPPAFLFFLGMPIFMTLILPPSLLGTESIAYSYVGSLPLSKKILILAKTIISSIIYLISLLPLIMVILLNAPSFIIFFMAFAGFQILSVVASIIFELMFVSKFFGKDISSANLYLKLYLYLVPMIAAFIIAMIPVIVYFIAQFLALSNVLSLICSFSVSSLEFVTLSLILIKKYG